MDRQALLSDVTGSYENLAENELTNLGIVLGAYRSFRGNRRKHIAYVSMPISSGKRYYELLSQEGVCTREELQAKCGPNALWEAVIQPNIKDGIAFADSLARRDDLLFIAPSVFEAKKWRWSQDAYMSLWYRVIGEMAGSLTVMDDWEYSSGGLREVMFAMFLKWAVIRFHNKDMAAKEFGLKNFHPDMSWGETADELMAMRQMTVHDSSGAELHVDKILTMAVRAIEDLRSRDLPYDELVGPAHKIMLAPVFGPFLGCAAGEHGCPSGFMTPLYNEAKNRLHNILAA